MMKIQVVMCSMVVVQAIAAASFIEIALPAMNVAPILSRQCSETAGSRASCHRLCQSDAACMGYITSRIPHDPCTCRYLSFPLCMLREPVRSHHRRHPGSERTYRVAIKATPNLPEQGDAYAYRGYSPVFEANFRTEFIERQVVWKRGKKYVRSSISESVSSGDSYDLSPTNQADVVSINLSSELECKTLCKESQDHFGRSCGMAFESTIKFSDVKVEICRLFDVQAAASLKTLEFTDHVKSEGGFQVSDMVTVFANNGIKNDLCLSPVRWNYHKVIVDKAPHRADSPEKSIPTVKPETVVDQGHSSSNSTDGSGNESESSFAQSVMQSIERRNFWSRFAFCAVIPLSLVAIAVFSSILACRYSKKQLNGQLAQFWRWERAGIPSNDFRPADDDDARSLIF